MKKQSDILRAELKAAGASDSEISELLPVASSLGLLKPTKHSSPQSDVGKWRRLWPLGVTSIAGLVIGMALVVFSQTVLPGSVLYPVQKLSDDVAISSDSSYRGTVMMKRAQQVKQLIAEHADSSLVMATLADYQSEAATYKSAPANYAVFEYCKNNLQQAAANAPSPERDAINKTLVSLSDV
jgi:hypothetical protein